jgi:hypothetical protein
MNKQLFPLSLKVFHMVSNRYKFLKKMSLISIVSVVVLLLIGIPVSASLDDDEDYPIEAYANPNNPYGWGNAPPYLAEVSSTLTIEPLNTRSPSSSITSKPILGKVQVTISPFSVSMGDKTLHEIVGYVSGTTTGVTFTIAGKKDSESEFSDITQIIPDEKGLFVWAVPSSQSSTDLFRVSAKSGSLEATSNAIRFTDENNETTADPIVTPVKKSSAIIKPAPSTDQTIIPISSNQAEYGLSHLTISASTTTPAVGETVTITGRLIDQNGKGISGATVTMDETGYSGDDPLTTTQTSSDGSFKFTVGVSYAYTVGMQAHYDGDKSHSSADSNTIMFSAH